MNEPKSTDMPDNEAGRVDAESVVEDSETTGKTTEETPQTEQQGKGESDEAK